MRVLFWGTPDFGIPSLDAMRDAGHEIVGVVTNPDRPAGRGRKLKASPVKEWAVEAGVPVLQPERPRGPDFEAEVRALNPEISVVAAYGQILRDDVLALPPLGSINVHASALPELRGAAPVNWAIIRGHEEAGVTIMRMVLALDAGPMIRVATCPIGSDTTAGELYDTLARLGAETLVEALDDLAAGRAREVEQDDEAATYAPKMDRELARMDWSRSALELALLVRGCDPWPGAWTTLDDDVLQVFRPTVVAWDPAAADRVPPGTILPGEPATDLVVATGSGALVVGEVKPAGKRRMGAGDWLRGRPGSEGRRFV